MKAEKKVLAKKKRILRLKGIIEKCADCFLVYLLKGSLLFFLWFKKVLRDGGVVFSYKAVLKHSKTNYCASLEKVKQRTYEPNNNIGGDSLNY